MSNEDSNQSDPIDQALADLRAGMAHAYAVLDAAEARVRAHVMQEQNSDSPQGQ